MGGFTPIHPWTHFLSQAGLLCLTCSWVISFCLWGRVLHLRGSSFLSLYWRAIHSGDTQYQCLFGLLHPFLCPALFWLEWHGGFNYFTIRIILLGGGGPWMRNHLHFRFQGDWWCIMYLQAWQFLAGCGVRGDLGGLPWGWLAALCSLGLLLVSLSGDAGGSANTR